MEEKKGLFARIREGLAKTRRQLTERVEDLISYYQNMDDDFFDELEEILILSDLGAATASELVSDVRRKVQTQKIGNPEKVKELLRESLMEMLGDSEPYELQSPTVLLMIGVNGVGKTTATGKLAAKYTREGRKVLLAAADTFRAAAIDQLAVWSERAGVPLIRHQEGADPAAVVFDAVHAASSRNTDLLICDTAGRLHNKKNLMDELSKIHRVLEREAPDSHREVWLVLDATTGQNAVNQARVFREAADITGIVLTKLDGTAKGGIVATITKELGVPVRFIGVGEGIDDLEPFDARAFCEGIL